MEAFVSRYSPEKFTPYMHVFVSHIGFFLKEYKEIESFANYDIETKNADNKGFVQRASNRFGGVADCAGIAVQQLEREYRMQELGVLLQPTKLRFSLWIARCIIKANSDLVYYLIALVFSSCSDADFQRRYHQGIRPHLICFLIVFTEQKRY
jgi:hypothetical protein